MTPETKQEIINAQESDFVKELKNVADNNGYETYYIWVEVSENGREYLNFEITEKDRRSYTPEIYQKHTFGKSFLENPKFELQTTSYGALNEEEVQKFMDAMNKGFVMIQYLNKLDWSKCPRIKIDEE